MTEGDYKLVLKPFHFSFDEAADRISGFKENFGVLGSFYEHQQSSAGVAYQKEAMEQFVRFHNADPREIEHADILNQSANLDQILIAGEFKDIAVIWDDNKSVPDDVKEVLGGKYSLFDVYVREDVRQKYLDMLATEQKHPDSKKLN